MVAGEETPFARTASGSASQGAGPREKGVVIQPCRRSTCRHSRPGIIGAERHPTFEAHPDMLGPPANRAWA
jgi:hypothetical protein